MRNIFKKLKPGYTVTLNQVHDTVKVVEGGDSLVLKVCADPSKLVAGLTGAQTKLKEVSQRENMEMSEMQETAEAFAAAIFGAEQARALSDFYANDPACVINVCNKYFTGRLAGKIADAQKKLKT